MSIDRFTLHSPELHRGWFFSVPCSLTIGRGWDRPLDVQGSGLEGTVGAEIGDQRGGAKVRSAREAQIFLVVTGLEQEIESAVAIDIGILRLPGRKAAAEIPPIRCGSKAAAGRC